MLLYFDKNGVLKEQLTYGKGGFVGDTTLQIFAYFEEIDDFDIYNSAYIRFYRPDLGNSEYPALFLSQVNLTYDSEIESNYFSGSGGPNHDGVYPCYLFDFSKIQDSEDIVTLLNIPGLWRATITLLSVGSGAANVNGMFTFNVEGSESSADDDDAAISYNVIVNNIANTVATHKLSINSGLYLRVYDDFVTDAEEGTLPAQYTTVDSYVYDKESNAIYNILTITENTNNENTVFATYEQIITLEETYNVTSLNNYLDLSFMNTALTSNRIANMILTSHQLIFNIHVLGTSVRPPFGELVSNIPITDTLKARLPKLSSTNYIKFDEYTYRWDTYKRGNVYVTLNNADNFLDITVDSDNLVSLEARTLEFDIRIVIDLLN